MDFFTEFKALLASAPRPAVSGFGMERSAASNYVYRSRAIAGSFFVADSSDVLSSSSLLRCRDCSDCTFLVDSELCYECVDSTNLYQCSFVQDCHGAAYCDFCLDCVNCKNCFGCFGLRNQQFRIFNKSYSATEYAHKVAELKKKPPEKILEILLPEFKKHPRLFRRMYKSGRHVQGDALFFTEDSYLCFETFLVSDCLYVSDTFGTDSPSRSSLDCDFCIDIRDCYQCHAVVGAQGSLFLDQCVRCEESEYLRFCADCKNCFGCVYLRGKEFCIVNRQYTREEYFALLKEIKEQLKAQGIYGKPLAELASEVLA